MLLEHKLKTSEVARLEGISTRALYDRIKAGRFPPPDFPSYTRGSPSYWLESSLKRSPATPTPATPTQRAKQPRKTRTTTRTRLDEVTRLRTGVWRVRRLLQLVDDVLWELESKPPQLWEVALEQIEEEFHLMLEQRADRKLYKGHRGR